MTHVELLTQWQTLKQEQPSLRIRDAASALGVGEAALLATGLGSSVTRLDGPLGELIEALPSLGTVMVLTRNEHGVHEKVGQYGNVSIHTRQGLVLNRDVDLRIFLDHWRFAFAVVEDAEAGTKRSLQFFDRDGTAVHKVHLRPESDVAAFDRIVERFRHPEQSADLTFEPLPAPAADRPDSEIDVEGFRKSWLAMKDVHEFFGMLKSFGLGRMQALRLMDDANAYEVAPAALRQMLQLAVEREVPIMCFLRNSGCIQIHTGQIHTLKEVGPWFNILDPGFNLHLKDGDIAHAWVVRKPTKDGIVTSLELFNSESQYFLQFFGERAAGNPELESWRGIVGELSPL